MTTPYKATDGASAAETMAELGKAFELDKKITDHIVTVLKVKTLQDFRYLAIDDDQVDTVIFRGVVGLEEDDQKIMLSRLRRAWNAVRMNIEDMSRVRIRGDDQEDEISALVLLGWTCELIELISWINQAINNITLLINYIS